MSRQLNGSVTPEKRLGQNSIVQPLLTDLYQITMAYAYWKSGKIQDHAVFDLFFRKNPFQGEFTIFAGLEECVKFLDKFSYSKSDIDYIRQILPPTVEEEFYKYLGTLDARGVSFYAVKEGSVVFPRIPLLRVEGPLIVVQLLETTLLNLVNYASLIATNASRYRMASNKLKLYEFGLRRAQGPDGALSASKYSYIGGFDGTSNVLAGKLFNIPVKGTHAHAYVTSFNNLSELVIKTLEPKTGGKPVDFVALAIKWRESIVSVFNVMLSEVNDGEFAAFISFAISFPNGYLALVDTYDVKKSGLVNFSAVALALLDLGYEPIGIRLDSGDLAYLSVVARNLFIKISEQFKRPQFANLMIMASNDINEETILSLNEQGHEINAFGIGTHLVTCQKQPALGGVYKMVEINGHARIKLSHDVGKVTIPGRKDVYRLYGENGNALIDLLQKSSEAPPKVGEKVLCRHPFEESKRAFVTPSKVEKLLVLYWQNGKICQPLPNMQEIKERVVDSLRILRADIRRTLNPTPYKVAVSDDLYRYLHDLWLENAPIGELA
ncbi:nicotinate phosphoribosyltransferase [Tribolium castaneum]|uniref:Nicotinate phosphoribosyltransferase n=1 Tax=Tribolium castaneum TaxID=7070 RepID=D6X3H3_TRICA|nr:PREDICTED: nicotinate phosphoribosyltransferase [Tribolium castaneum]EEZ97420.1 Nicotinate phosphoribosyltransferase-like Protein [Tribolium castaneum]|eukprot:XP_972461.1 PREDICTED: nicotinate phosphoribosyltransferase [Tribolium castaneum]